MSINDGQLDRLAQAIYEQLTYQNWGDWHWSRRTPAEKQMWLRAAKAAADAAPPAPPGPSAPAESHQERSEARVAAPDQPPPAGGGVHFFDGYAQ